LAFAAATRGRPAHDEGVTAHIEYALGNHYAAAERLIEALEAYKRALLASPGDQDAKHNLEVIARQLARTPWPTPSPTPQRLELTPTPGANNGEPQDGDAAGTATAQAGNQGTPSAGGTPGSGDASDMTPEEVQRALDEALRGIDEDFTVDEALRVLDLLERQNRSQLQQPGGGDSNVPDY
jgi:hypothetical protein